MGTSSREQARSHKQRFDVTAIEVHPLQALSSPGLKPLRIAGLMVPVFEQRENFRD